MLIPRSEANAEVGMLETSVKISKSRFCGAWYHDFFTINRALIDKLFAHKMKFLNIN